MRLCIILIGVLFLIVTSAKDVEKGKVTIAEGMMQGKKERVVNWMYEHSKMPVDTLEHVYEEAHKYAFPELLIAIAKVESNFDPYAVSHDGSVGLMQIMLDVWEDELKQEGVIFSKNDLFNISRCMAASSYILEKYLMWEGGNIKNALKRYAGARRESRYHKKILETLGEIHFMKQGKVRNVLISTQK